MLSAIEASSEMLYFVLSGFTESAVTCTAAIVSTLAVAVVSVTSVFALEHAAIPTTARTIRNFMRIPKEKLIVL
jgi:hypothetical protein